MHQQWWVTREANKLIRLCRQHAVSPIPLDDLTFVGFGDCGWGVRRDGSSPGGSMIIAADKRILDGFEATTTMVDWKSYKRKRVCAVPLLVRFRPTWEHLTCWNSPRRFTLCSWVVGKEGVMWNQFLRNNTRVP